MPDNKSMVSPFAFIAVISVAMLSTVCPFSQARAAEPDALEKLPINQLQFIGTHNSYHIREPGASNRVREWNYSHAPLEVQLDRGVRSFELDLHSKAGEFEVFHVPLLDEGTTCRKLADALQRVRTWSEAHPRHVPISFLFELKKEGPKLDRNVKRIDSAALDHLDEVLRAAFPPARLITPDNVRGDASTLRDAITSRGWPTLEQARGRVLFILHDDAEQRELYTAGRPSLEGRAMFVRSDPSRPDAAALILDNPRDSQISPLCRSGYFIRTRADSDLGANFDRNVARRDAAFASGAHILSTDFPSGEAQADTGYSVEFPSSAPARVNPVNGPESLRGKQVSE
ncbi:MAG TPA: Ca2+-dependent phosphoinositide-specific phospholipase C [Pirellulales bacterium]|jgi:hypothetical protein